MLKIIKLKHLGYQSGLAALNVLEKAKSFSRPQ